MPSTTRYGRGDVAVALYPFTGLSTSKKRPGVVVSGSWVLDKRGPYVIPPITSNVHGAADDDEVRIRGAEIAMSGLVAESLVKTSMLFSLDPCLVTRQLGRLPGGLMAQVDSGVHAALREVDAERSRTSWCTRSIRRRPRRRGGEIRVIALIQEPAVSDKMLKQLRSRPRDGRAGTRATSLSFPTPPPAAASRCRGNSIGSAGPGRR